VQIRKSHVAISGLKCARMSLSVKPKKLCHVCILSPLPSFHLQGIATGQWHLLLCLPHGAPWLNHAVLLSAMLGLLRWGSSWHLAGAPSPPALPAAMLQRYSAAAGCPCRCNVLLITWPGQLCWQLRSACSAKLGLSCIVPRRGRRRCSQRPASSRRSPL